MHQQRNNPNYNSEVNEETRERNILVARYKQLCVVFEPVYMFVGLHFIFFVPL